MHPERVLKYEATIWKTHEFERSKLKILKNVCSMPKMLYAGCLGPSPAISAQFTLKTCVAAKNRKKFAKPLILGVQGHSRSSTLTWSSTWSTSLTPTRSLLLLLVMISSISVPICNRFHTTRADSGKITTFQGGSCFNARLRWPP